MKASMIRKKQKNKTALQVMLVFILTLMFSLQAWAVGSNSVDMVETDGNSWSELSELNIFQGSGGDLPLLAPGSAGSYQFTIKNSRNHEVEYQLKFSENISLPLLYRLRDMEGNWLLGSSSQWISLSISDPRVSGILVVGEQRTYELQWRWLFDENQDERDTVLGNMAVEKDITYHLMMNMHAEEIESETSDDDSSSKPGEGSAKEKETVAAGGPDGNGMSSVTDESTEKNLSAGAVSPSISEQGNTGSYSEYMTGTDGASSQNQGGSSIWETVSEESTELGTAIVSLEGGKGGPCSGAGSCGCCCRPCCRWCPLIPILIIIILILFLIVFLLLGTLSRKIRKIEKLMENEGESE